MGPLLALVLAATAPPVALLPPDAPGLAPEALRAATDALAALPAPHRPFPLDSAVVRVHLAAAGPGCRGDLACICSSTPLPPGTLALDLSVRSLAGTFAVDLRLVAPCEDALLDRRAEVVEDSPAALARFTVAAVEAVLGGRDLAAAPPGTPPPAAPSGPAPAARTPAAALPAAQRADLSRATEALFRGDFSAADKLLSDLAVAHPRDERVYLLRGHARLGLGRPEEALTDYRQAEGLAPALAMPMLGMAEASRQLGRSDEAIRWYEGALHVQDGELSAAVRDEAKRRLAELQHDAAPEP